MMATIDVFLVNVRLCFLVMNSGGRGETQMIFALTSLPKLFASASSIKIFACSTRHATCAKPAVPRHAHRRTRPSFVFQWRACVQM